MVVNVSKMNPVGPNTSTVAASNAASARLKLDSHFTPRSTPLAVEAMYSTKAMAMMVICTGTVA
ncbi:hypothetical protein D3C72_2539470 [compost metagenome]